VAIAPFVKVRRGRCNAAKGVVIGPQLLPWTNPLFRVWTKSMCRVGGHLCPPSARLWQPVISQDWGYKIRGNRCAHCIHA
jgi:hypothetical protein